MRTRVALTLTIATAAATAALIAPAGAGAVPPSPFPCDPACRILVNAEYDAPDKDPGDHICATGGSRCTLRAAIQEANALALDHLASKVLVPEGDYVLTRHGLDDTAALGDLDVRFIGEIKGAGQGKTEVDGDDADRAFDVFGSDTRLSHLAVRHGHATDGPGGGIRDAGVQNRFDYLYVTDNVAEPTDAPRSGQGGGIGGSEPLIHNSYIAYNDAQDGGGVFWAGSQAGFARSTIAYNHATRDGGGLYLAATDANFGELTISGNSAGAHGGGVFISPDGVVRFDGSTVASNRAATASGGGFWRAPGQGEPLGGGEGLIVARNEHDDCAGGNMLASNGGNLDSDGTCGFGEDTDRSEVDPLIGSLAYNGGPTPTRKLDPSSPAVDIWNCHGGTDQRGAARPQQETCDAGAYEVGSACCPPQEPPFIPGSDEDPTPRPVLGPCGYIFVGNDKVNIMIGGPRRNEFHGRGGADRLFGHDNDDCLFGERGNDLVEGGAGADRLSGGAGADELEGGDQEDVADGGPGNDRILGGSDDDRLSGGHGDDYIRGGSGFDTIQGGRGDDLIDATRSGFDQIDCGPGDDTVRLRHERRLYRCEHVKIVP